MLQEHFKGRLEIVCCVAGSEGWNSRTMVNSQPNFFYTEVPNQPLGQKMNKALELASRLAPDYCLLVGSDDVIGINLMERYFVSMQQGIDYTYLMDCYFFDVVSKRGLYWGGYLGRFKGMALGMGRLISAKALHQIRWILWPPGYDRILDTAFDAQMRRMRLISRAELWMKKDKVFGIDVKSPVNMTKFEKWENSEFIDGKSLLFDNLPTNLATLIYETNGRL